ncbi:MAG: bifunctional 4-hydroxy-2-oxoglutarate aldolase/2-dehydro-3-deoxy-phosphogluconate aldolase [Kiloniellales bacterium]|nr:bifunctional 4-hydroxy-2-oxoglutarate aldolase/2-dehydro-3-deoxy-phosphogluconate aldolase [Kiloniellales bacterium]
MLSMREICGLSPVIPVLEVEDAKAAGALAKALVTGGLQVLEVTLRTPAALNAIKAMAAAVPEAIIGAGTLLSPLDVAAARRAGARFGVSPGATERVLEAASAEGLPLLPGAATPTEAMALAERGYDTLKLFPAEAIGGTALLKALAGPLPQIAFCPTGGVSPTNARAYLALPNVVCVGGSWVAPKAAVAAADWRGIEQLALRASKLGSGGGETVVRVAPRPSVER